LLRQPTSCSSFDRATANDCLDIGIALGSPVSLDHHKKVPFKFNGTIGKVNVKYIPQPTN
jgi:hypothetical protein